MILQRTIADLAKKLGEMLAIERQRSSRKGEEKEEKTKKKNNNNNNNNDDEEEKGTMSLQIRELETTLRDMHKKLDVARATARSQTTVVHEATSTTRELERQLKEANSHIESLTTQLAESRRAFRDSETKVARISAELAVWRDREREDKKSKTSSRRSGDGGDNTKSALKNVERKREITRLEGELVQARSDFNKQRALLEETQMARDLAILRKNELQSENGILKLLINTSSPSPSPSSSSSSSSSSASLSRPFPMIRKSH